MGKKDQTDQKINVKISKRILAIRQVNQAFRRR
jgi:hypothetical protein